MKQIIQSFKTGKMEIAEVPVPQCSKGTILVKIMKSVISAGTEKMLVDFSRKSMLGKAKDRPDLVKQVIRKMSQEGVFPTIKKVLNKLDTPIPLGYSASGIVVKVGEGVFDFKVGDRVAIAGASYANHAEFDVVPVNLAVKMPKNVSFDDGAFSTIASIGLQGIRKANPTLGERVAVLGLGLIGQMVAMMLKGNGCKVIGFDPDKDKVELALKNGIDVAVFEDIEQRAFEFSEGYGVDKVIITASAPTNAPIVTAGEIVKQKGKVVMVGMVPIEIPRDIYYKKELDFLMSTSYGPGRYDSTYEEGGLDYPFSFVRWTEKRNIQAVLEMIDAKILNLETLKTHSFAIENAKDAYDMIEKKSEKYLGIILNYPSNKENEEIPKQEPVMLKPFKKTGKIAVSFIGCGNFASSVLIPAFKSNSSFYSRSIVSRSGYSAYSSGKKFDVESVLPDTKEIYKEKNTDAVVISTRHNEHAKKIVEALENGVNVFVEKPLAMNKQELKEVVNAVKKSEKIVQVGFNRRFSPLATKLKKQIEKENSPVIINYDINAGVIPNDVWIHDKTVGGGRIVGEVCHFIDLISYLTNSEVKSVVAISIDAENSSFREDDNFSAILKMKNGSIGYINYHAEGSNQVEKEKITGSFGKKSFVLNNFKSLSIFSSKEDKTSPMSQEKGFKEEVKAFAKAIKKGEFAISLNSMVNTTLTTFAIEKSLVSKEIVDVEKMEAEIFQ